MSEDQPKVPAEETVPKAEEATPNADGELSNEELDALSGGVLRMVSGGIQIQATAPLKPLDLSDAMHEIITASCGSC
jgi:hypothetical protein